MTNAALAALVDKAVEARLAPIKAQLARLVEQGDKVGAKDVVGGLGWKKLSHLRTGNRLWCSVLAAHFVGSMVINSLALHIFYGYAWAVLIARIPNALVLTAVNTVLLRILLENRALMAVAKR